MQDENNVNLDTSNETATDTEIILDDGTSSDDIEVLREQNKKLFERAKKAEAKLKTSKPAENITKPNTYGIEDEVLDLRLEGFSKSEVEFIMKNGGRKALEDKNSLTAIAIQQKKEQDRAERAASQAVDNSSMSEVERKFTTEQLRNMSASDLEKLLPHA
ncbi:MAG: hypothetical protein EBR82_14435 [Caulobacteraceae bacterium]|nr:hypothetical protein [Caulobacteraceae bacterium]